VHYASAVPGPGGDVPGPGQIRLVGSQDLANISHLSGFGHSGYIIFWDLAILSMSSPGIRSVLSGIPDVAIVPCLRWHPYHCFSDVAYVPAVGISAVADCPTVASVPIVAGLHIDACAVALLIS
jgi:hypothetical protein